MRNLRSEQEIMANWKGDPSQPVVSICCITYNHEPYIEDALEGFLVQETDFPFEILIHDDASTDKTADIIREYESAYPTLIKPIYQTENQYSKGRKPNPEFNFPRAKGEYIALCEGDDYWTDPLKLQKQVPFLEGNLEYSMCCHSVKTIFEDNWKGQKKERFKSPIDNATFLEILDNHFIPTNSLVFRNIIKEWPAWLSSPNMISGDIPLEHMLAYHGKLKYIYENMAVKRINAGGVTADPQHENLKYKFKAEFYYYINIYTKYHYIDALFKKILGSNKAMIKKSIKNGNLKETTCCIFRIISTVYIRYMKIYY